MRCFERENLNCDACILSQMTKHPWLASPCIQAWICHLHHSKYELLTKWLQMSRGELIRDGYAQESPCVIQILYSCELITLQKSPGSTVTRAKFQSLTICVGYLIFLLEASSKSTGWAGTWKQSACARHTLLKGSYNSTCTRLKLKFMLPLQQIVKLYFLQTISRSKKCCIAYYSHSVAHCHQWSTRWILTNIILLSNDMETILICWPISSPAMSSLHLHLPQAVKEDSSEKLDRSCLLILWVGGCGPDSHQVL